MIQRKVYGNERLHHQLRGSRQNNTTESLQAAGRNLHPPATSSGLHSFLSLTSTRPTNQPTEANRVLFVGSASPSHSLSRPSLSSLPGNWHASPSLSPSLTPSLLSLPLSPLLNTNSPPHLLDGLLATSFSNTPSRPSL